MKGIFSFTILMVLVNVTIASNHAELYGADDFIAPSVASDSNLPAHITGQIFYDLTLGAFRGINKNGTVDTLSAIGGGTVTSDTANERIERVALDGNCASAGSCGIASKTSGILSVTRSASTGIYSINFTAGKFSVAPTCVVTSLGTSTVVCTAGGVSATAFNVNCQRTSTEVLTDTAFNAICMGPR